MSSDPSQRSTLSLTSSKVQRLKISIHDGNPILIEASQKIKEFLAIHQLSGPFVKENDDEHILKNEVGKNEAKETEENEIYYEAGENETFQEMKDQLEILDRKQFENRVLFKKLTPEEVTEKAKKEAAKKFADSREAKMEALKERIENVKKMREEVSKLTSIEGDKFLDQLEKVKSQCGVNREHFSNVKSKSEAISAMNALEVELSKAKSDADYKLDINFSLRDKCLALLNSFADPGVEYHCISEPTLAPYSGEQTKTFFSKRHWEKNTQSKFSKQNKFADGAEISFDKFGESGAVAVSASYKHTHDNVRQLDMSTEGQTESTQAVVSKQAVHQLVKFQATCAGLSDVAEDDAWKLTKVEKEEQNKEAGRFLSKYPESINFGPFGVGGSYEILGTSTSSEKVAISKLEATALKHVNAGFKSAMSFGTLFAAGSASGEFQKDTIEETERGSAQGESSITVTTNTESFCYGPKVTNPDDLMRILYVDPQKWSIFPSPDGSRSLFVSIWDVIEKMAPESENPAELKKAAEILKQYSKQMMKKEEEQRIQEEQEHEGI